MAAPATGSDGSGYKLSKAFGHSVKKPLPALVQLRCRGDFFKSVAGVRTEAKVSLYGNGEFLCEDRGELQLTDYGISGIPVFQVSRFAAEALDQETPRRGGPRLSARSSPSGKAAFFALLRRQQESSGTAAPAGSLLNGMVSTKSWARFSSPRRGSARQGSLRRAAFQASADQVAGLLASRAWTIPRFSAVNPFAARPGLHAAAWTTRQVDSVAPWRQGSRRGLYFAGELLDVDGICGGYNLQWAWSSGYLAGKSAAEKGK